tara:strand:+ start:7350 stop:10334 length:2985 start_codon:yes stop_codon:yes gene_type:complete
MNIFHTELKKYGAQEQQLFSLSEFSSETLRYIDLVKAEEYKPEAVLEEETGQPLAYIVDSRHRELSTEEIKRWRRALAMRGTSSYMAVIKLGRLDIYTLDLDNKEPEDFLQETIKEDSKEAPSTFSRLHLLPHDSQPSKAIHEVIFSLMKDAIDAVHSSEGTERISTEDALSLVGRALFTRFLIDRKILKEEEWKSFCPYVTSPSELFNTCQSIASTNAWLDETFNGDFLPFQFDGSCDKELSTRLDARSLGALSNILYRAPKGQLPLVDKKDKPLGWDGLDFGHIPVGVLSQVYEQQAQDWSPDTRRKKSIYYTPAPIAEFMVREVFLDLAEHEPEKAHKARVLDPAAGGGVFLICAFKELFSLRWETLQEIPSTDEIREILYNQLTGFDIERSALRLTALSLYLTAIELDPNPYPLKKLRFRPLKDTVLLHVGDGTNAKLGSLGPNVPDDYNNQYDVVISNPPWTALTLSKQEQKTLKDELQPAIQSEFGIKNPTISPRQPEVAFMWRALEWCHPGGRIAFALNAGLLFKQSNVATNARSQLLQAFQWTGVLNGAELRRDDVWPKVEAPFALIFGVNTKPEEDHQFYFYSPHTDKSSKQGRMRIDAESAHPIYASDLRQNPWLLKALFRGSRLDVVLLEKILDAGPPLESYWGKEELYFAENQVATNSGERDASFLYRLPYFFHGLPYLTIYEDIDFTIDVEKLPIFEEGRKLRWPRRPEMYKAPLLLIETRALPRSPKVYDDIAHFDISFPRPFYGLNAHDHENADTLFRYTQLLLSNSLFRWFCLLSSGSYGVEREAILLDDVKNFPIPRWESLSEELQEQTRNLSERYNETGEFDESCVLWLRKVYGLTEWDWQVITDTLSVNTPDGPTRKFAQAAPKNEEIERFCVTLSELLSPMIDSPLSITSHQLEHHPWIFLHITPEQTKQPPNQADMQALTELADMHAASQMVLPLETGLLVGILKQNRFWTQTRARLLALDLLRRDDINWSTP